MSRRIDIELTSARPDGSWTWRAAGAKVPKGVLEGAILPDGSATGDVLRVEAEFDMDGISISSVVSSSRVRKEPTRIELIPSERKFDPVMQTLAPKREGGWDRDRGDRPRRDRGDRPGGDRGRPGGDRGPRPEGGRGPRPDGERRGPRPEGGRGPRPDGERRGPRPEGGDRPRRDRPRFEPVPELPQRPRPKRLKPGKAHRNAVLAGLPEEQKAIAEKALQGGIPAVRQAVQEQNIALRAAGQEEIPAAGLLKMAEELLPRLRAAEWLDRADAAKADLAELDLRDLRSVVAASEDPMVAREEATRSIAAELKAALLTKQDQASQEWIEDIGMAVEVGRVIRALKLSSEPPKAGMRFPTELGAKLAEAATASLSSDSTPDRWIAVLEAVAFSPIRAQVTPAAGPTQTSDDLTKTVQRLAAAIPQIASLFGLTVAAGASLPKPQRPARKDQPRKPAGGSGSPSGRPIPPPPERSARPVAAEAPVAADIVAEPAAEPAAEAPVAAESEVAVVDAAVIEPTDTAAAEPTDAVDAATEAPAADTTPEMTEAPAEVAAEVETVSEADSTVAETEEPTAMAADVIEQEAAEAQAEVADAVESAIEADEIAAADSESAAPEASEES